MDHMRIWIPEIQQVQKGLGSKLEHMQIPKWEKTRCPEENKKTGRRLGYFPKQSVYISISCMTI